MNTTRLAQASLILSAITLIVVVLIASRPVPEPVDPIDNTAGLQFAIDDVATQVAELRTLLEGQPSSSPDSQLAPITERLDRLEGSVAAIGSKLDSICRAIQSSPFAPSGFSC